MSDLQTTTKDRTTAGLRYAGARAVQDALPVPFWLDNPAAPGPRPPLEGDHECELAVVGGGYTGLWAALLAKERDPSTDVLLVEADRIGWQASGRNGGFCLWSLTHGAKHGFQLFPDENERLDQLGMANLDEIERAVARYGIDCGWERTGDIEVATEPWEVAKLEESRASWARVGQRFEWLDREAVRAEIASPTFLAGLWLKNVAFVDPARLAWGLARACEQLGVRIHEHTPASELRRAGSAVAFTTPSGTVRARRVVLATNAFPPLLRRLKLRIVPIYDYALITEPLSKEQREAIGWRRRQGFSDGERSQFHYARLTHDDRIQWGGYDAIYHYGSRIHPQFEQRPQTFVKLAEHFFTTFPQLEGLRFTHAWGGVIDTCARLCPFFGTAMGGRVAYALGYTGNGVGSSRFGAQVALDLLGEGRSPLAELAFVRTKPLPWPPEPLRFGVIQLTRWSFAQTDSHNGRGNLWLRLLDRIGVEFGS
jgi:glycine/D-amino acid oxidase-like deaminating enzyme